MQYFHRVSADAHTACSLSSGEGNNYTGRKSSQLIVFVKELISVVAFVNNDRNLQFYRSVIISVLF